MNFMRLHYQAHAVSDCVLVDSKAVTVQRRPCVSATELVHSTRKSRRSAGVYTCRIVALQGTDFASTAAL